jgi:hypothetical protein
LSNTPLVNEFILLIPRSFNGKEAGNVFNLHKTIYFIVVLFGSKLDKILAIKLPSCEKDNFFDIWQIKFLLFHRSITKIVYHKRNKIHHKMQREKLYNLHSKAYCNYFQKEENSLWSVSAILKIWSVETLSILKTRSTTTK